MSTVGERIRGARQVKKLSRKALAELAGISESAIRQYENDLRKPRADLLNQIATALEIPLVFLLTGELGERLDSALDVLENAGFDIRSMFGDRYVLRHKEYHEFSTLESYGEEELMRKVESTVADANEYMKVYIQKRLLLEFEPIPPVRVHFTESYNRKKED